MYGTGPYRIGTFEFDLPEMMHYLYLPVVMDDHRDVRLPPNVVCCRPLINAALRFLLRPRPYHRYVYLSARKGWASPDNPLNRPGWHTDGFGTDDMNFVWWVGPGTRFAVHDFHGISNDHLESLKQFEEKADLSKVTTGSERTLYAIDPCCVHATPIIEPPGCMRQYVKISFSDHRYNLADNSHNYLFQYDWPMHSRSVIRNDPHKAQLDYVGEDV